MQHVVTDSVPIQSQLKKKNFFLKKNHPQFDVYSDTAKRIVQHVIAQNILYNLKAKALSTM